MVDYAALLVCVLVLFSLLPAFSEIPPYMSILFYLLVPGYAFVRAFFTQISNVEKLLGLVAFSIGLSTFVEVLIKAFMAGTRIPPVAVSSFLSIVMLGGAILRDRR
jgi:uncharacterized membrane protein